MKEIYAVMSGSYSDYRVNLLCETLEQAQAVLDRLPGEGLDIEELPIGTVDDLVVRPVYTFEAKVQRDGTPEAIRENVSMEWCIDPEELAKPVDVSGGHIRDSWMRPKYVRDVWVTGNDREACLKKMGDLLGQAVSEVIDEAKLREQAHRDLQGTVEQIVQAMSERKGAQES